MRSCARDISSVRVLDFFLNRVLNYLFCLGAVWDGEADSRVLAPEPERETAGPQDQEDFVEVG